MNVSHPLGKLKFVYWLENIYVGTPRLRCPYRHNKNSETAAPFNSALRLCFGVHGGFMTPPCKKNGY